MKALAGNKVLCALLATVAVGMGAQTYYLIRVHKQLDSRAVQAAGAPADSESNSETREREQNVATGLQPVDPLDDWAQSEQRIQSLFDSLYKRMDRGFGDLRLHNHSFLPDGDSFIFGPDGQFGPRVDLQDLGDRYELSVDVPGADESEVHVQVESGTLVIEGSRTSSLEAEESGKYVRRERHFGRFERRLPLPADADPSTLRTECDGGILRVTIEKID